MAPHHNLFCCLMSCSLICGNATVKLLQNFGCLVVNLIFLSSGASFNTQPWLDTGHPLFLTENWQSKAIHWRWSSRLRECRSLSGGGGAPERYRVGRGQGARSNSRQRQSLDILTIAVKVEVKQEEDEHAVVPVDENAPGPFTWPELQTAQMLINSRDFLSWLNHFPQLVSHNWNMRYYFPPLQNGKNISSTYDISGEDPYESIPDFVKILRNHPYESSLGIIFMIYFLMNVPDFFHPNNIK